MAETTHVLVVEDNPVNQELVVDILSGHGFEVETASTAQEAFDAVKNRNFDLILMDISLPGMDGLEAVRRLKADPATAAIPCIALTAHAMAEDVERSRQVGCTAHVTKPFRIQELLTVVEQVLHPSEPPSEGPG